jgi:hypothetical protein
MDKERLYEDNMALKLALNAFQAENTKIRTKVTQLEREISKKDDLIEELSAHEKTPGHKYIHLVASLKQTIKESKIELKNKEDEILKLKRNIRSSKLAELEVEIQTYIDECTRLTHNIEDLMRRQGDYYGYNNDEARYSADVIIKLKKEKQDLLYALNNAQDEVAKFREKNYENEKLKKNFRLRPETCPLKMKYKNLESRLIV